VLAVGVSPDGVEFDAADGELVNVVFLVVAETHNPGPNVEVLAEIGSLMQVPGLVGSLSEARDVDTFLAALNRAWEEA